MVYGTIAVLAYIGPGPGLTMLWALVGLVVTILSAVVAILFLPARMILRRMRGGTAEVAPAGDGLTPDSRQPVAASDGAD